ncbi:hypothetical protein [Haloechinothrix salitolerans]|uniref:WXG100 family type VII secretion target n=1 Tax=Haloechinothrix salitolerans TaxID=926830 RepID=A0ABW2C788_9PSEU
MTGGYGAVPEQIQRAANDITDVVGRVANTVWSGPSGDYGHPGVQTGWARFIEMMRDHVEDLKKQAEDHSTGLFDAVSTYFGLEDDAESTIGAAGSGIDDVGGAIGGALGGAGGGFINPDIASKLNPTADEDTGKGTGRGGPLY